MIIRLGGVGVVRVVACMRAYITVTISLRRKTCI